LILERLDQIQCIPQQEKAAALTISLLETFKAGESILGHGVLLRCNKENRFAILTAAHVAILAFRSLENGYFKKVRFSSGTKYNIDEMKQPELFFPHEYLCKGTHDVGVLLISVKGVSPAKFKNLALSNADPFFTEHFGRASDVQFKSTPTMVNKLRVRLPTESKPSCSGTPLFSPCGELLSVVHGVSKHRGRRGHTQHSGDGDNLSTHVYVDMVKKLGELVFWGKEYAKCVYHLEFLDEEEVKDPKMKLKNPSNDSDNDNDANDQGNGHKNPSDGAEQFYYAVKKLFQQVDPKSLQREAFNRDHFTLAEFCLEISLYAQTKPTTTLAHSLISPEASTYEAVCCSDDSA